MDIKCSLYILWACGACIPLARQLMIKSRMIQISSSVADEPQWSTRLLWLILNFGHPFIYIYILIASFPQDSCLVPRVLRVLPIPFFVSMVKASREPKWWRASEVSYICEQTHQW